MKLLFFIKYIFFRKIFLIYLLLLNKTSLILAPTFLSCSLVCFFLKKTYQDLLDRLQAVFPIVATVNKLKPSQDYVRSKSLARAQIQALLLRYPESNLLVLP